MGANAAGGLAMVVASGCKNWCYYEGELRCAFSVSYYMDVIVSMC